MKELGLEENQANISKIYETCAGTITDKLINSDADIILKYFNIFLNVENELLPSIYWLPKLHKNPAKARFIIAALKCL